MRKQKFIREMGMKCLAGAAAAVLCAGLAPGAAGTARAAELVDYFDAQEYAGQYPDVKAAFGEDAASLLKHYLTFGVAEGRESSLKDLIDLKKYREANADLDAAFGDNWQSYLDHYLTYGAKEGRSSFGTFDAIAYADRYPDLKAVYGDDISGLFQHWVTFGKEEGRTAATYEPVYESGTDRQTGTDDGDGSGTAGEDGTQEGGNGGGSQDDGTGGSGDGGLDEYQDWEMAQFADGTIVITLDTSLIRKDIEKYPDNYEEWLNTSPSWRSGWRVGFTVGQQAYEVAEVDGYGFLMNGPDFKFDGGKKANVTAKVSGNIVEWNLKFYDGYGISLDDMSEIFTDVYVLPEESVGQ